ncbi:MAG: cytochrome b N-terminal domain-containing protein [Gemmatimonadetes bacterium]|nr:cytochrome b N-terminal domain-containing protein [Gemmatimonadota bacterium]
MFGTPLTPRTEREQKRVVLNHLLLHNRPVRLPERTIAFRHTFGLGGMSATLVGLLILTGVLLMFVYEPSPDRAYGSIEALRRNVRFGGLVRNVHYWSANLLVFIMFLHLLRTFFTGAFHGTRQFNWVIGVLLLLVVLAANFTGYLLPWDQLSFWAITIVTGMLGYVPWIGDGLIRLARGGAEIGSATLINFYTFHTTVIPVTIVGLMAFHFWRVRKAGGVVIPYSPDEDPAEKPETVLFVPSLLVREFVTGLVLVAIVMVLAVTFDAGLDAAANPGMSPNPAKAPWYFLGLQELLLHFHPTWAVVILPGLALLGLIAIPYLRYDEPMEGAWFVSETGRSLATAGALAAVALTPVWVLVDEYVADWSGWLPGLSPGLSEGLVPAVVAAGITWAVIRLAGRQYGGNRQETLQAAFAFLATALVILTAVGVWFRGEGMALGWPWTP